MEVSWLCFQRAGVTEPLWFCGRNMRILGADMDQEAGTALIKYNYESAPFPWVFGFWVSLGLGELGIPPSLQKMNIIASPLMVLPSPCFTCWLLA